VERTKAAFDRHIEARGIDAPTEPRYTRVWEPPGDGSGTLDAAAVSTIIWATGFRPSVGHLAPLRLREESGGIRLIARLDQHTPTTAARDERIQFVGYGPSASTIGANRAGRAAVTGIRKLLRSAPRPVAAR